MQDNDWRRAAAHERLRHRLAVPGERIVGRDGFVAVLERYPTNTGRWTFDVHRVVAEEDVAVSEVTVTDGEQAARVVAVSILDGAPRPGRAAVTRPIPPVP
jgi:hypothetical protein